MPVPAPLASFSRFVFLTLPNYSLIACSAAIEALRMANYVAGETAYGWQIATVDGAPAESSGGVVLGPTVRLTEARAFDALFVCGGVDVRHAVDRATREALRRLSRRGAALGALCTGAFALAEAGLLDGYRCAVHWENLSAVREEFEGIDFAEDLFVIDRDRFTCTGGAAPLDMMAAFIEAKLGRGVAERVAEQFMVERLRGGAERQHPPVRAAGRRHPAVDAAADLMARTLAAPLPLSAVASRVGLSVRQLERLFRLHAGAAPGAFYMGLRLNRARDLLRQSDQSVTAVAVACGFVSSAHFAASFRRRFGHTPRGARGAPASIARPAPAGPFHP